MIIATSGHVDHGKTSLVKRITGIETDRLEEEKKRGLTIDLGYAYSERDDNQLGFIDVPGHIRFINNMVAGVGEIDFGLLVVAADDGPMPQTREHLAILNLIGVSDGAIAISKIDRVDTERLAQVRKEIDQLVVDTFLSSDKSPVFEVSNETGDGIPLLIDYLFQVSSQIKAKAASGHFRLSIDRSFTVKGSGLVVTGSVLAGEASVGDQVVINPGQHNARIRGIHRQNKKADSGRAGDRCAINLTAQGLEKSDIHRGSHLSTNQHRGETNRCDVQIKILNDEGKPLKHWTSVHVHSAASHTTGRIATLESNAIAPGSEGLVQLVLTEPLSLCAGDSIILRDQAAERTLGGGIVLDPKSVARGRAKEERVTYLNNLSESFRAKNIEHAIAYAIDAHPYGISRSDIEDSFNFTETELDKHLAQLEVEKKTASDPKTIVHAYATDDGKLLGNSSAKILSASMSKKLESLLNADKQKKGASLNQISSAVSSKLSLSVAGFIANQLVEAKQWAHTNGLFSRYGHQVEMSSAAANLWKKVEPILNADPIRPPVVHDLAKTVNLPPKALDKLLLELTKLGCLVKPVANRYFLPEGMTQLEQLASDTAQLNADGKFTVKEYRDVSQLGRNLCIEILEYFDIKRITQRLGDHRIIITKPQ
jgi:selenocysteine-specific elongation factor